MTNQNQVKVNENEKLFWRTYTKTSLEFIWDKFAYSPKRRSVLKNFLVSLFAIIFSLIISLFIAMMVYNNGSLFGGIMTQIFLAPFNPSNWKMTLQMISIFAVSALSFIFAQKVGLFNIGISGQMLFGAQLATLMSWYIPTIPNVAGQLVIIVISMVAGAIISTLIGLLKVLLNINEVISSIMFNWIIYYCGSYMLNSVGGSMGQLNADGTGTAELASNFQLAILPQDSVIGGAWLPLVIIMAILVAASITILSFSVFGKKISSVGLSNTASQYAGINVKKKQIVTMAISGMIAGILGVMIYCGKDFSMITSVSAKTLPQEGYTGISVGLIAMVNPIGVLPVSLLFGMIDSAKASISANCAVDPNIAQLMFGVIVYGAAVITAFYFFTPWVWLKQLFYGREAKKAYQEFNEDIRTHLSNCNNTLGSVVQIRKTKRNILRMKLQHAVLLKKFRAEYKQFEYYLENKDMFKTDLDFEKYCSAYAHAYVRALSNFADMQAHVPHYLKKQFDELVQIEIYNKDVFKWNLINKIARIRHRISSQSFYFNEIVRSPSVVQNFKDFGVDINKLNSVKHIKEVKARVHRYYAIYKEHAKNNFKYHVVVHRKNKYDLHNYKYLYEHNQDSKFSKEVIRQLTLFRDEARDYADSNNSVNIISLKFKLRERHKFSDIDISKELVEKTNLNSYWQWYYVSKLINDKLANRIFDKTNFKQSPFKVETYNRNNKQHELLVVVSPQLKVRQCPLVNVEERIKNKEQLQKIKEKIYKMVKKFIMRKQSYVLQEQLLINKRQLLDIQVSYISQYSPKTISGLKNLMLSKRGGK